jgi:flagellar biosynthesis regulator FlbT
MKTAKKKKNFSGFDKKQAFKQLNLKDLIPWSIEAPSVPVSDFFQRRLARLKRHFDLESYEESKKLLIDAICEEGLEGFEQLKIWKGAVLESDILNGNVDYLVAENQRYLEAPMLCIVEAKKDDFEQGLAQCLVEMQACQWQNQQLNKAIDVFGIVTNGDTWKFYKLAITGVAYETLPYALIDLEAILGTLRYLFQQCEQNLD